MADRALPASVELPITWTGFDFADTRDADRTFARFRDANGARWQVPMLSALEQGLFDWPTSTADRRDRIRAEAQKVADSSRRWRGFFEGGAGNGSTLQ